MEHIVIRYVLLGMLSLYPKVLAENKGQDCAGLEVCQKQRRVHGTELPGNERNRRGWEGREQCWRLWIVMVRLHSPSHSCQQCL